MARQLASAPARPFGLRTVISLSASLALSTTAFAQQPAQGQAAKPAPKSPASVATPLADEPFTIESVGLSFYLPAGAAADGTSIGAQSTVTVEPSDKAWYATITTPRTSNPDTGVRDVAQEAIKQILESSGTYYYGKEAVAHKGKVVAQEDELTINDRPAARFYISLPRGGKQDNLIRGQTIFKVGADRFVIFEFYCSEINFARARGEYELMVGTASFAGAADAATARVAAVEAGLQVLSRLSEAELREIALKLGERWERLYMPAATEAAADEQEIAYRRVRVWLGERGELSGSKPKAGASGVETQQGILVRVDARSLDQGRVLDSQGVYFVSFDRNEEAWTLKNAIREGRKTLTYTETGARSGRSMTISTQSSGDAGKTIKPVIQGDGYLSRVESFMVPQILINHAVPNTYAFYTFQSDTATIRLRRDELSQPPDREGLFVVSTRLKEDSKPMVSRYTEQGELIQTQMPDGSRWEPITLDRLVRLWRDKNLPMD